LLLTDIEGSTRHWESSPEGMRSALEEHDRIVSDAVKTHGGEVLTSHGEGDSFFAVFPLADRAVAAACDVQRALATRDVDGGVRLQVRMALHSGEAEGDYRGPTANRCARIRACGHGGQVLLSATTAALVRGALPPGVELVDLGRHRLRDLSRQERLFQLVVPGLPAAFPPLRSLREGEPARLAVLEQVRRHWLEEELRQSLKTVARVQLRLSERPDAVDNPLQTILRQPFDGEARQRPIDPGVPIAATYQRLGKQLLVLGEAGAGKTTLLLELLEQLLEDMEDPSTEPMPVVFHLSTWAAERSDLASWLVDELHRGYGVSRQLGRRWVDGDQVIPLLDGLDEVAPEHRDGCIGAINRFRGDHGLLPMVVCSRLAEYESRRVRLRLRAALVIEPLRHADVELYLGRAGEALVGVREVLREDRLLEELLTTPLFLSVVTLAYRGSPASAVRATGGPQERRRRILGDYVATTFAREGGRYPRGQTQHWLQWLASEAARRPDQSEVFFIERMQPDWLPDTGGSRRLYRAAAGALVYGAPAGLALGAAWGVFTTLIVLFQQGSAVQALAQLSAAMLWLLLAMLTGALAGAVLADLNALPTARITPVEEVFWSWRRFYRGTARCLSVGLLGWAALRLTDIATAAAFGPQPEAWIPVVRFFLPYVLAGTLVSVVLLLRAGSAGERPPAGPGRGELVASAARGAVTGLAVAVSIALIESPLEVMESRLPPTPLSGVLPELSASLVSGLLVGLVAGLASGWSGQELRSDRLLEPGQGVWQAARNGVTVGLCSAVVAGLWAGAIYAALSGVQHGQLLQLVGGGAVGVGVGVVVGMVLGLMNGGSTFVKHFVLRSLLWRRGLLPWRYARFLDHAVERRLLRRVGGGYTFVHALLRDYFADLYGMQTSVQR
jgi:class 3 adenylate cyclase